MNNREQLVIIGSGPAALTAAVYSARARLNPLVLEGPNPGGQLMGTTIVENWPGDLQVMGPDLMKRMKDHAAAFGTRYQGRTVRSIRVSPEPNTGRNLFTIVTERQEIEARAIIIATGATPKKLNIPGESEYWGKGVSTCAVCDGVFYAGKRVVIVGGGDTAMEDASFMAKIAASVTIIQNLPELTASRPMQERVLNNSAIKIRYATQVVEVKGDGSRVTHVTVRSADGQEELEADGLMLAIGLRPNSDFLQNTVELTRGGYIQTTDHTKTSVAGIFVAGDVADDRYRQAITSSGTGCMAALDAERYLAHGQ